MTNGVLVKLADLPVGTRFTEDWEGCRCECVLERTGMTGKDELRVGIPVKVISLCNRVHHPSMTNGGWVAVFDVNTTVRVDPLAIALDEAFGR